MKTLTLVAISLFVGASSLAAQSQAPSAAAGAAQANSDSTAASAAPQKTDPAKAADIQRLLEVAGTKKMMADSMAGLLANIRPTLVKSLPPGPYREKLVTLFFERVQTKMQPQQFVDMAAAAYDKYLTDDEIKGLIAFYQTPLGQKTLTVLPQLTIELQKKGMEAGEQAGRESMQEVLAEHPDLAQSLQDAAALRQ
ncbi:MAG TPA: DUF2059 domain-containing protein [Candidatus Acidoferrum sp.]|nr:DUF2059 domain-containing protein [Candidatus Acidoferrum sp.]